MKTYVILINEPTEEQISDCIQISIENVRTNQAGTKWILKYSNDMPDSLTGLTEYNQEEIRVEMAKAEWDYNGE